MPKRKMRGGRTIGGINPVARSNNMARPQVPTPSTTWDKIKNFAKQHKIISRGLKAVSGMVGEKYSPFVNAGANLAESYGYGKKKRGRGYLGPMGVAKIPKPDWDKMAKAAKWQVENWNKMKGSGKVVRF
jgi:hypothetical protein